MNLYLRYIILIYLSFVYSNLASEAKINVYTLIEPISYLVESIGGNKVNVKTLIPSGRDPHIYEASPKTMLNLSKTNIYFKINLPIEITILKKMSRTKQHTKIFDISTNINYIKDLGSTAESADPHIWLGISQIKQMTLNITKYLILFSPKNSKYFKKNLNKFLHSLDRTKNKITKKLKPFKTKSIVVFHPAFAYLIKPYAIKEISIEVNEKLPSPRYIFKIINTMKRTNIKTIFVHAQFETRTANIIAKATNSQIVKLDPMKKNILENIEFIADKIKQSFTVKE